MSFPYSLDMVALLYDKRSWDTKPFKFCVLKTSPLGYCEKGEKPSPFC